MAARNIGDSPVGCTVWYVGMLHGKGDDAKLGVEI